MFMLALDTTELSETDLKNIVARHLSPFGHPTIIKVMPRERREKYKVIAVKMATLAQARFAATQLGHSQYGPIVVIKLAQRGINLPLELQSQLVH
jgi:hypothetical protein